MITLYLTSLIFLVFGMWWKTNALNNALSDTGGKAESVGDAVWGADLADDE